jgi:hypothetical protein
LLGFISAVMQFAQYGLLRKRTLEPSDRYGALNDNVPEGENEAARLKLKRRTWNAPSQLLIYASIQAYLPDNR